MDVLLLCDPKKELETFFKVKISDEYHPRYNAAPSQLLPVILNEYPHEAFMLHWGIQPSWLHSRRKDGLINVRSETLREKHIFASDVQKRRCLVLADGFYEWKKTSRGKMPYRILLKNENPFTFAGIWEVNDFFGETKKTFAIITTASNNALLSIHDRMPVILDVKTQREWLEEANLDVLAPFASEKMKWYRVSAAVNNVKHESPELIHPIEE